MAETIEVQLLPSGRRLRVERGTALREPLFAEGVEFPCGGRERCKGCRVKLLQGELPIRDAERMLLTEAELREGWRLVCRATAETPLTLELAQWEGAILADDAAVSFVPREGLGVAVDLGTTTLVAQLLDLRTGDVLAVRTGFNGQAAHGGDIMSRIDFALAGGEDKLRRIIREQVGTLITDLFAPGGRELAEVREVVLVGNTVMHHLFCGFSVEPLSRYPFEPKHDGPHTTSAAELGWSFAARAQFLACLGGFVGSDILAGLLAAQLHECDGLSALIDLGTNGEIVVGTRDRMLCASTAAGPAFEGARISMGMRATTGAIAEVLWRAGEMQCRVLGDAAPRGICGSGLVDAVAAGLGAGLIDCSGRMRHAGPLELLAPVQVTQRDIRELQLAKAAIAAGLKILVDRWGASIQELQRVYLAGAFGNYISRTSAQRIGLLPVAPEKVEAAGNTALRGAKLALLNPELKNGLFEDVRSRVRHVSVSDDDRFQEIFVEEMSFPTFATGSGVLA